MSEFEPGERFFDRDWEEVPPAGAPHIWRTLGYRRALWEPGHQVIEWNATEDFCFPSDTGYIVHGGMLSTLLDTAMGGACWSLLNKDEAFLTGDLRVEFLRAARPGMLRAEGNVVRKAKRVIFCSAELFDASDRLLAAGRCTQVVLTGP
jgi:uncharacterized protein (TIGR00369 family)